MVLSTPNLHFYTGMGQSAFLAPKDFFVRWYSTRGRSFPWREEDVSPFQILLTEMLLRQTQATQVEDIWPDFMCRLGTPWAIQEANREEIRDLVRPLGFVNQRTRALKVSAEHIISEHDGTVPSGKESLLDIPHIGPYSSQAVRCFAFEKRVPIVDTSILRFLCRVTGRQVKRPDIRRVDWAWEVARSLLPESGGDIVHHNYGLLDFTAEVCTAQNPGCEECSLSEKCVYGRAVAREEVPTVAW